MVATVWGFIPIWNFPVRTAGIANMKKQLKSIIYIIISIYYLKLTLEKSMLLKNLI